MVGKEETRDKIRERGKEKEMTEKERVVDFRNGRVEEQNETKCWNE